ncbi:hypothetical protein LX32DRAFT_692431 [Colletotrichum zoysiae]|uniref:Uncharacterized protein n=1 Tax=Colletotrichum zoysiae TaxID=1216348 RepID=A0AAD9M1F4_9PEZI|nr:hypothetical protein LX32DRAFT_692431 [Colletotrichum zoysiae]
MLRSEVDLEWEEMEALLENIVYEGEEDDDDDGKWKESFSIEQTASNFRVSFCLTSVSDKLTATTNIKYIEKHNRPGGAVYPENLAYHGRYFKKRVDFCNKTLFALDCG